MKVLFATTNPAKLKFYAPRLKAQGIELLTLADVGITEDVEETGATPLENAIIKAEAYNKLSNLKTIAIDEGLYFDNIPEEKQPGVHVRRVGDKRLNDAEMIEHYLKLVNEYSKDGKLSGYFLKGIAIATHDETKSFESKANRVFVNKQSEVIDEGYPLASLQIIAPYNKFKSELTAEEEQTIAIEQKPILDFFLGTFKEFLNNDVRMNEKEHTESLMFRIGEFSKLTQVSIRMLRHYDEVGLLKPEKVDDFTHYRFYTSKQIPQLKQIIFLRNLGFNINEIEEIVENWSNDFLTEKLQAKATAVNDRIKQEEARLLDLSLAMDNINRENIDINYSVTIKSVPAYNVISLRRRMDNYYMEGYLWKELSEIIKNNNIKYTDESFTIYHDEDYREEDVDIELCVVVPEIQTLKNNATFREVPAVPLMASIFVYGDFSNISGAFRQFAQWLEEHNQYKMAGGSRQIVHRGPWNETIPENYIIEIQVNLTER